VLQMFRRWYVVSQRLQPSRQARSAEIKANARRRVRPHYRDTRR
jgi:hypothetical protein